MDIMDNSMNELDEFIQSSNTSTTTENESIENVMHSPEKKKDSNTKIHEINNNEHNIMTENNEKILKSSQHIRLGICAMDKKSRSKPMSEILSRLDDSLFEIIFFGDDMLLNDTVDTWPVIDVIIAFYSSGYPLSKVEEYVKLRKPYVLNDLEMQRTLMDRRKVYDLLEDSGIDVPRHVYMNRDGYVSHESGAGDKSGSGLVEYDDHIEVNGVIMNKPFVEKPVDSENHNIAIYYPTSAGGGCKKLFRKIGDRSSEFYPDINTVRRNGSYIYEEFVETQGTDVKMYTVGPDYGHAEARKSPAVDGKVERNSDGKEVRFPLILTLREKEIARRIVLVFKQHVCGFDLLRVQDGISYVCDVNGFSFVKNSRKYYEDCACILSEHMIALVKPKSFRSFSTVNPLMITKCDNIAHCNTLKSCASPKIKKTKELALRKVKRLLQSDYPVSNVSADDATDDTTGPNSNNSNTSSSSSSGVLEDSVHRSHSFSQQPVRDIPNALAQEPASLCSSPCGSVMGNNEEFTHEQQPPLSMNETSSPAPLASTSAYSSVSSDDITTRNAIINQNMQQNTHQEELRCVIAVIRHGDRTPKQKLKVTTNDQHVLDYFHSHSKNYRKDLKIKHKKSMEQFLRTLHQMIDSQEKKDPQKKLSEEDQVFVTKIYHMRDVLERWKINGLNRKLQIKPLKWEEPVDQESSNNASIITKSKNNKCIEVQLILKWGGNLTKLGEKQAITLGQRLRHDLYPDAPAGGLLRLHSTFRHDLKIKTSDEGRVMKTAAAFSKGLLELEGEITPILVSLVHKERTVGDGCMLDPSGNKEVKSELEKCKNVIAKNLQQDIQVETLNSDQREELVGPLSTATSMHEALSDVNNPRQTLFQIHVIIGELVAQLDEMLGGTTTEDDEEAEGNTTATPEQETLSGIKLYKGETLLELTERWRFLYRKMYSEDKDTFDLSRIPDVHDNVRFDMLHNPHLGLSCTLEKLYTLAKKMADCVVPQEYGTTLEQKRSIGNKMCRALMEKIKNDLIIARTDNKVDMRYMINMDYSADLSINTLGRRIRTRLYFTSESHLHTLLNVLRIPSTYTDNNNNNNNESPISKKGQAFISNTPELCYLTQIIIRLFEDPKKDIQDPKRFRVEIFFSPGATATPLHIAEMDRDLDRNRFDTSPLECISKDNVTCHEMEEYFEDAMKQGCTTDDDDDDDEEEEGMEKQGKKEVISHNNVSVVVPTTDVVAKEENVIQSSINKKHTSKQEDTKTSTSFRKRSTSISERLDELADGIRNTIHNIIPNEVVDTPTNNDVIITTTATIPCTESLPQQTKNCTIIQEESFIVEEKVQLLATAISYQLFRRTVASMTMVLGVGCIVLAGRFNYVFTSSSRSSEL